MINIVKSSNVNLEELTKMAIDLWPDNDYNELKEEIISLMNGPKDEFFLAKEDDEYIGFIHMSIRSDYVEGSDSSPVGFVEGIYVKFSHRNKNIARELFNRGVDWVKSKGCTQVGSDIEHDNYVSYDFHKKLGFEEVNKIICFIKDI